MGRNKTLAGMDRLVCFWVMASGLCSQRRNVAGSVQQNPFPVDACGVTRRKMERLPWSCISLGSYFCDYVIANCWVFRLFIRNIFSMRLLAKIAVFNDPWLPYWRFLIAGACSRLFKWLWDESLVWSLKEVLVCFWALTIHVCRLCDHYFPALGVHFVWWIVVVASQLFIRELGNCNSIRSFCCIVFLLRDNYLCLRPD